MPLTLSGELTQIERAALEHYGAQRSNLNEPTKAEAVAQAILDESIQAAVKVYLTQELPKLTDLGQRFLNLPPDKQSAVLEILGGTLPEAPPDPAPAEPAPVEPALEVPGPTEAAAPVIEPEK